MSPLRRAVLDTSVLSPLLAYAYAEDHRLPKARRTRLLAAAEAKSSTLTDRDYERWLKLFESLNRRLITTHVVAEIYQARRRIFKEDPDGWRFCEQFLREHTVEVSLTLPELHRESGFHELTVRIGPTDAGLILAARREGCVGNQDAALITWDSRTLLVEAQRLGIRCQLLEDVLSV